MGIGEQMKGAAKEQAGKLLDDDELRAEGEAQRNKGAHQAEETKDRAKAKAHEAKAEGLARQQEALEED